MIFKKFSKKIWFSYFPECIFVKYLTEYLLMKPLILSLSLLSLIGGLFAQQVLTLSNQYGALNNGDTIITYVENSMATEVHVYVTNNSASALDVKVKKDEIVLLSGAFNTFCWGQCFSPSVIESPNPVTINAGQTDNSNFYADYNANGSDGETLNRYTFFDANSPNDSAWVFIKFVSTPASVQDGSALKYEIFGPYPNPASSRCQFSYTVPAIASDARIVIMDLAGNIVNTTYLAPREGKVSIDVTSFASGIYFYSLWVFDKPVITRKLIVQK